MCKFFLPKQGRAQTPPRLRLHIWFVLSLFLLSQAGNGMASSFSTWRSAGYDVLGPSQPQRESVVVFATGDTWVNQAAANTNFGTSATLSVSRDEFTQEQFSLLAFDVSTSRIPGNAVISNASLFLSATGWSGNRDVPITVSRITENWGERSTTWNSRPAIVCCAGSVTAGAGSARLGWDITELVSGWFRGDFQNQGLALRGPATGIYAFNLNSRENAGNRPSLVITYSVPAVPGLNVQAQAIEVTQAIHGPIPARTPPDGLLSLTENMKHVAGRPTVVRVYPWVTGLPAGTLSEPLTAQLYSSRSPTEPINPANDSVRVDPNWTLADMRSDEDKSWNFALPEGWVEEGDISLWVVVNPAGPNHRLECPDCELDNNLVLSNVQFIRVQTEPIRLFFYLADFYERDASGAIISNTPAEADLSRVWAYWLKTWPIAPRSIPWIYIRTTRISNSLSTPPITDPPAWDNRVYMDEMAGWIRPGTNPYLYIPLLFSPLSSIGCSGAAGIGYPPLFHAGACGSTFAQEAAHTLGNNHASNAHGEAGGGPVDPNYPGIHGEIEPWAYGFDLVQMIAVPPVQRGLHTHDFMSYGGEPRWVSLYTWNKLIASFQGGGTAALLPEIAQGQADYLRVSGEIHNGAVKLDPVFTLRLAQGSHDGQGSGSYQIRLLGAGGGVLFTRNFEPQAHTHEDQSDLTFYEIVPAVPGLARIEIRSGNTIIAAETVTAHAPQIQIEEPAAGTQWGASGQAVVAWQGIDADRDPLTSRVEGSPDGQTWYILAGDTTASQVALDLASIPGGGDNWRIRVRVSDGVNTGTAEVSPIRIATKPPKPVILTPLDGARLPSKQPIAVSGVAASWVGQDQSNVTLEWRIDARSVGTGASLEIPGQSAGSHTLALRATDSAGLSAVTSVQIVVGNPGSREYLPLLVR
jgi:hypothetical protein